MRNFRLRLCVFFFFNDTATTDIYTLSLHDALPIWRGRRAYKDHELPSSSRFRPCARRRGAAPDRKSTRLNSSHTVISYAVFCLKKKKKKKIAITYKNKNKQQT